MTKNDNQKEAKIGISSREEDFSQWYQDVIAAADLAESSPVRGCMVIKPNGYAIWENIQKTLDDEFKKNGVKNAYFPLFIPKEFFEKEAEHVEGFATECAVVTHHRLEKKGDKLVPAGKLENPLVVRPTSETIIYSSFSKWIESFRDLPVVINQWANIVRWEMRTRLFLRTTEFLWQEGHTAHADKKGADEMTTKMLNVYKNFVEEYLAIPVIAGKKSDSEKFAGADYTTSIEAMMQDGKALQAATSHMLGQNFAKPFNVQYADSEGDLKYVYQTSWGLSTRIIGALIMTHSDDKGLVIPPKIAATQAQIIPIYNSDEEKEKVMSKVEKVTDSLRQNNISVDIDDRDERPGSKFFDWEQSGTPIRIEIGPKDVQKGSVVVVRRDTGDKKEVDIDQVSGEISEILDMIQSNLFELAKKYRDDMTYEADNYEDLINILKNKPGFVYAPWCMSKECEMKVKDKTTATTRVIPLNQRDIKGKCAICGEKAEKKVIFAKAY